MGTFIEYEDIKDTEDMVMIFYKCVYISEIPIIYTKYVFSIPGHLEPLMEISVEILVMLLVRT